MLALILTGDNCKKLVEDFNSRIDDLKNRVELASKTSNVDELLRVRTFLLPLTELQQRISRDCILVESEEDSKKLDVLDLETAKTWGLIDAVIEGQFKINHLKDFHDEIKQACEKVSNDLDAIQELLPRRMKRMKNQFDRIEKTLSELKIKK